MFSLDLMHVFASSVRILKRNTDWQKTRLNHQLSQGRLWRGGLILGMIFGCMFMVVEDGHFKGSAGVHAQDTPSTSPSPQSNQTPPKTAQVSSKSPSSPSTPPTPPDVGTKPTQPTSASLKSSVQTSSEPQVEVSRKVGKDIPKKTGRVPVKNRSSTFIGATGLAHTLSADPGPQGTIRFGMQINGFSSDQFLTPKVNERFLQTHLYGSYTPIEALELYLNTRASSHYNPLSSPSYLQTQGDLMIGVKGSRFWNTFGLGLALDFQFLSDPDGGWKTEATQVNTHLLMTFDWTRRADPLPIRFLIDAHYCFENSEVLFENLPQEPSLIQEWGYRAGRYDRLILNFGLEAVTQYVNPFVEYHIGTPFLVEMPRLGQYANLFSFDSIPHWFNFGLRSFVKEHLSVELGGSLGLSDQPTTGVSATPPWSIMGGFTYTLDPRTKVVERPIEIIKKIKPPPPPKPKPLGTSLTLTVIDALTKQPISGARLELISHPQFSPQLSNEKGEFKGYRLKPGLIQLQITADNYKTLKGKTKLAEGRDKIEKTLKLKPSPAPIKPQLSFAFDPQFPPERLQGWELSLYGPDSYSTALTSPQQKVMKEVKPGRYALVIIDQTGRMIYENRFTLADQGRLDLLLKESDLLSNSSDSTEETSKKKTKKTRKTRKKTKRRKARRSKKRSRRRSDLPQSKGNRWAQYSLKHKWIRPTSKITFDGNTTSLNRKSKRTLKGIAQLILETPRIKKIRIDVHTHNVGGAAKSKTLGLQRAEAIRSVLNQYGVAKSRVSVNSYGMSKNIALNLTQKGRQKNQRVLFKITQVK